MKFSGKLIIGGLLVTVILVAILVLLFTNRDQGYEHFFEVQRGELEILVTVTGELEAENSVTINGPQQLASRNIRLRNVLIQDLVPEGTVVDSGDWVATLDRNEAELSLRELEERVLSEEAQYNSAILDTTIQLSNRRDEIVNLRHALEESKLTLEQSSYEPPATIRQAEINLERARIALSQAEQNYHLHERQAIETVREAGINLERRRRRLQALVDLMAQFEIISPQSGMVIYHREWNGEKRTVGSTINSRDLTVAVIPDLNTLVSRAYVNEIDVNRVRVGQKARLGVDAYPERSYQGEVIEVSNVGQELPNTDAKVFEVLLRVDRADNILRPAMTTSNVIVTASYQDVHYIPFAALHDYQGFNYVYRNDGTRQIVIPGNSNDNFVIIKHGLSDGDLLFLSEPENPEEFEFVGQDLLAGGGC